MDKIERRAVSRLLVPTQVRGVPLGQEAPEPTCASRGDERPTGTYPAYRRSRVDRRLPGIAVERSAERARNPRPRAQPRASPNTAVATRKFHINPALAEVHAQIALLQIRGTPELGEPGEWMCWRPGEESFEHVARAAR